MHKFVRILDKYAIFCCNILFRVEVLVSSFNTCPMIVPTDTRDHYIRNHIFTAEKKKKNARKIL